MKALVTQGKGNIKYETVPDPQIIKPTDVIVQVSLCGICGSDLHVYHEREKGCDHGTVMGHEFTGTVIEKGKDVKHLSIGDEIISPFSVSCGACFYCVRGLSSRCVESQIYGWVQNGHGLQGAQAEYVRVPLADSSLIKIPEGISHTEALLLGDVFSTGYFCADMANIDPKGVYVVIGCGPVGLMAIIAAKELGAENVYAIDLVESRLAMAKSFGAIPLNLQGQNVVESIKAVTNGRGADAVMELVGNYSAAKLTYEIVRPGGIVSVAGVHNEEFFGFSPTEAYNKNLTYKTGRCPARVYFDKLIPILHSKKHNISSIISHTLPLNLGSFGYEIFDKKLENCTKVLLKP